MDFLAGLVVGLIWYEFIIIAILVILWTLSLEKESGAGFVVIASIFIFQFTNIEITWVWALVYAVTGISWLLFKFRLHALKIIGECKEHNAMIEAGNPQITTFPNHRTKGDVRARIFNGVHADSVFFWGVAWPFSVIGFFIYDFMEILAKKLVLLFSGYINRLLDAAGFTD